MTDATIQAIDDGPLKVDGPVQLLDGEGTRFDVAEDRSTFLCRCGGTASSPFCDGTHAKRCFEATSRVPEAPAT